jgi:hypothetical protein
MDLLGKSIAILCGNIINNIYSMLEINYTYSLGNLCHGSQILKRNNYKKCSYPFDCLEDDFNIFLDKSYYINHIRNKMRTFKIFV